MASLSVEEACEWAEKLGFRKVTAKQRIPKVGTTFYLALYFDNEGIEIIYKKPSMYCVYADFEDCGHINVNLTTGKINWQTE